MATDNEPPQCELCGHEFTIVRGDCDDARFCDACAQEIACELGPEEVTMVMARRQVRIEELRSQVSRT